ncbi:RdRP-domain-containing protein [Lentinula aciculospora]|uniref:RNA-dependent RNA polymerase n=1 Tax=Lentinula aciculospora TaxID=153920 RepID=A0A9W9AW56_9AGAR|nr:RdRP-domain-containing protein [Lentinula aciculospora]
MDIFVSNIPHYVDREELLFQFHRIIHRAPFIIDPLLNFDIFVLKTRNRDGKKSAILTLPNVSDGHLLLNVYSSSPICIAGTTIVCQPGKKSPRENTLARIRGQAWEDPELIKQERKREQEASVPTPALKMSFGRLRRDGSFTNEYSFVASIHCDLSRRRLGVTLERTKLITTTKRPFNLSGFQEHISPLPTFWYPSSSVQAVVRSKSTQNFELFLEFSNPATFEQPPLLHSKHPAQRLAGLPDCSLMPLVSQNLHILFTNADDLLHFLKRASEIQLPHAKFTDVSTIESRVYATDGFTKLSTFTRSLPFPLGFQLEKSVWDGIIEPSELCERNMQQEISRIQNDHPEIAAAIFRYFVSTLRVPTFRDPSRPPPRQKPEPLEESLSKSARRRRRRRNRRRELLSFERVDLSLREHLAQSADAYVLDTQRPQRRYATSPNLALYQAYHISITPSRQVLEGPFPDLSNGILRLYQQYQDCFLRVSFQDENGGKPRRDNNLAIDDLLERRYKPILLDGVTVAGRSFEFLGYSMSSLKDYTFIFVTKFFWKGEVMNAAKIRGRFGNIPKASHRPALSGARWGQMFSASTPSVLLTSSQIEKIPDRTSSNSQGGKNAVFSDGCSTLAPELARTVARRVLRSSIKVTPSCFQFRLGGAKGVLFQDPRLSGEVLCIRPSQTKFESIDMNLDITLTSARPLALFLNRPLIALLEHHGVPQKNFVRLQDQAIRDTQRIKSSLVEAATTFSRHGLGTSFQLESLFKNIAQILHLEIAQHASETDNSAVQLVILKIAIAHGITHILREIKHRAHIRVPGSYTLLGVSDEWDCLEEGEIFAQVYDPRTQNLLQIEGRLLITRSPQIHPGDCQFVRAVHREELVHLKNVVVFSCKGDRSLPSMLGGGDLDGDIYNLILDDAFHPPKEFTADAGAYEPLPPTLTPHPCGIRDVVDFVINYVKSDLVGYISTTHLRISDVNGLDCSDCLKLAEAASHAVDFPKVGTAVDFQTLPRAPEGPRPDYLSGEGYRPRYGDDRYYPSAKVLGKLYRRVPTNEYEAELEDWSHLIEIRKIDPAIGQAVRSCLRRLQTSRVGAFSATLEMDPEEDLIDEMHHVFQDYREQFLIIAKAHTVSKKADIWMSEEELISGAIMERHPDPRRRREVTTAMNLQTQELTRMIRLEFSHQDNDLDDFDEDEYFDAINYEEDPDIGRLCNQFNRARAAWIAASEVLTHDDNTFGAQSFAMIALGSMLNSIKALGREANTL